eukprot:TRINITY_DN47246_c0_g1_i1.p2 TRINITY_DN47246_c0_g1~~TRINITY_DN47246_c0_g1_i1.p2  ORF type:complete len:155 (+),score=41.59 TRINITY_DN47246_c0_g1_i1:214-678(+)
MGQLCSGTVTGFEMEQRAMSRTSSSANLWVETVVFSDTASCFDALEQEGYTSFATTMHSQESSCLYQTPWTQPRVAVWFGNETRGLTDTALSRAERHVHIEMQGMVESLNLAVSTGIVLSEIWRQRSQVGDGRERYLLSEPEQHALVKNLLTRK